MSDSLRRWAGRPPLDPTDPSVDVNVRLPSKAYEAIFKAARDARCNVPELIRRELRRRLAAPAPESSTR